MGLILFASTRRSFGRQHGWLAIRAIDASERSYIDVMDQPGVGLPAMLVLKLPPANRTLVRGILAALDPQVFLERVAPHVLLAALETRPRPLRSGCKEKFTHYLDSSTHPPDSIAPRSAQKDYRSYGRQRFTVTLAVE